MKVSEIVEVLENIAPPPLAEDWDNVGLLVGDSRLQVKKIMLCVDLTREVLAEAVAAKVEMILAYHPVIFKGLTEVTYDRAPIVYEAIRRGISIYSTHTAFDMVAGGTNDVLAGAMGVSDPAPLEPSTTGRLCKIVVCAPPDELSRIANAAFAAGAGRLGNYYDCAFFSHGIGTFCGGPGSHPSIGQPEHHESTEEMRLEVIAPKSAEVDVCAAIREAHSYEMPAIDVYPLENCDPTTGMGRFGELSRPVTLRSMITRIKKATGLAKVLIARATRGAAMKDSHQIEKVACGAGSCGSLFRSAVRTGATFYLTGEMRHHDLLAATATGMNVVCLGHSNSERIAMSALADRLRGLLDKVSVTTSKRDRDPLEVV